MTADTSGRKRRNYLIGYLWFSAVLLMALVIVAGSLVFQDRADIAAQKTIIAAQKTTIAKQQQNNIQQCQQANVTRLQDIAIWNTLIRYPASPAAAVRNKRDHLAQLVAAKDTPRNCPAAFSGK